MINYIKNSIEKFLIERKQFSVFDNAVVTVVNKPKNIRLPVVFNKLQGAIPLEIVKDLDGIYIGEFAAMKEREIESFFDDGYIFITNQFEDEKKMIEALIHEIAHCVEKSFTNFIYSDGKLKEEFLGKRKTLYRILNQHIKPKIGLEDFLEIDYREEFDNFLHKDIGYDKLASLTSGLFPSPYSATSLREYFAIGFEEYFTGDINNLKKISPNLFNKINSLTKEV